ncbi:MAG: flagellar hook-associated family protein [Pseudomonadota bacterium]
MTINSISTLALNSALRTSTLEKQTALRDAQLEVATGKYADVGYQLGAFTSTTISLDKQMLLIEQTQVTNSIAANGMTVMQNAMLASVEQANSFIGNMTAELSGTLEPDLMRSLADSTLGTFHTTLNTTFKGEHLFSGLNTDSTALVDYNGADGTAAKAAVQAAFVATFGFTPDNALAEGLTETDIEGFVNGAFEALFDDANWETLWSGSSERGRRLKISGNEFVENMTTGYNETFRTITSAAVLISEFADANFNEEARDRMATLAVSKMSVGIKQLGEEQSTMGVLEERIQLANEQMSLQSNILATQLSELTDVDPYEAALNLNQITTSLEASYAATARIQSLSLLNFI